MTMKQDPATGKIEKNALVSQAHASTYCLIDLTVGQTGTAVAVNVGSRYFLATAKHVIPPAHDFKIVLRDAVDGVYDFAARHVHASRDLGLLEVTPKDVSRFRDTFVPSNRLAVCVDQSAEYDVTVIGYPFNLIKKVDERPLSSNETVEFRLCNAFIFNSVALPLSEWPSSGTNVDPIAGSDIFINFDPGDSIKCMDAKTTGRQMRPIGFTPPDSNGIKGISGGGIWHFRSSESNCVWKPDVQLHGIQFSSNPTGWLRGALIGEWLDLVQQNYPDLKPEIESIRKT